MRDIAVAGIEPMGDGTPPAHPFQHGHIFFSPGCHFSYRVIGPCCRLFDREQLPWPCCRLQWRGKEPSWRRIGKRFVPDLGTKKHPSYSVEIIGSGEMARLDNAEPTILTLYPVTLSSRLRDWWHSNQRQAGAAGAAGGSAGGERDGAIAAPADSARLSPENQLSADRLMANQFMSNQLDTDLIRVDGFSADQLDSRQISTGLPPGVRH